MLFSRSEAWPGLRCSPHLGEARRGCFSSPRLSLMQWLLASLITLPMVKHQASRRKKKVPQFSSYSNLPLPAFHSLWTNPAAIENWVWSNMEEKQDLKLELGINCKTNGFPFSWSIQGKIKSTSQLDHLDNMQNKNFMNCGRYMIQYIIRYLNLQNSNKTNNLTLYLLHKILGVHKAT